MDQNYKHLAATLLAARMCDLTAGSARRRLDTFKQFLYDIAALLLKFRETIYGYGPGYRGTTESI